jgi:PAS domain-containing protein
LVAQGSSRWVTCTSFQPHSTPDSPVDFPSGCGMEIKFKSQASIALEQATVYLQRARHIFTRLRSGAADKLQDARRAPANDLGKLLANSLDAIVVTNDDQCLVDANPKALDLFGVSELNMRKFTIDTFLSHCQILEVRRKWFAIRRDERYGKCTIRRLDGSLRVADYLFVAKIIPRNHLYRFLNVTTRRITQLRSSAKMPISSTGDSQKAIDVLLQP